MGTPAGAAPDVVSGFFLADAATLFETAMGATVLPDLADVDPATFLPSSRSVAFTRQAWQRVGGYPEWLDYCEDLVFDLRLRAAGCRFAFAPRRRGPLPAAIVAACLLSCSTIATPAATARPTCGASATPSATPPTWWVCRRWLALAVVVAPAVVAGAGGGGAGLSAGARRRLLAAAGAATVWRTG